MSSLLTSAMNVMRTGASRLAGAQLAAMPARPAVAPRSIATAVHANMGKRDLIVEVKTKTGMTEVDAEKAVNAVLATIVSHVAQGSKVVIPGFGAFEPRTRAARRGRNPQTGEEIQIPETVVPAFSAGKSFKETVKAASK